MRKLLLCAVLLTTILSSCKKGEQFDAAQQARTDDAAIQAFMGAKSITAQKHASGLYYVISAPGSGNLTFTGNTVITVKYTGRFLDGTVFDQGSFTYPLGLLIDGWQIGIPLIQKGGKIRLLVPSALGYAQYGQGTVPPNAVLDFDIELTDATN